jgi:hypothetical protein
VPALLLAAALLAPPTPLTPALKTKILARVGKILDEKAFVPGVDFSSWPLVAGRHRKEIDAARTPREFAVALYGALSDYKISHLFVAPPGMRLGGTTRSFGFTAQRVGEEIVVERVYEGTAAEKAGLYPGLVLSTYWYLDYPKTDRVKVGYADEKGRRRTFVFREQDIVPKESPRLTRLADDAYALRVPSFLLGYDEKRVDALFARIAQAPYLVLDLRGNTGGSPAYVSHLLGYLLPDDTRVGAAISKEILRDYARDTKKSAKDRAAVVRWAPADYADVARPTKAKYKGRVAVLIDGMTGSAAEVTALALRDHAAAPILGTPSAGSVLFMNGSELPGGYVLYFPWRDYWTAKGERIEGKPILPDYEPPEDSPEASFLPEPLRRRALERLRQGA